MGKGFPPAPPKPSGSSCVGCYYYPLLGQPALLSNSRAWGGVFSQTAIVQWSVMLCTFIYWGGPVCRGPPSFGGYWLLRSSTTFCASALRCSMPKCPSWIRLTLLSHAVVHLWPRSRRHCSASLAKFRARVIGSGAFHRPNGFGSITRVEVHKGTEEVQAVFHLAPVSQNGEIKIEAILYERHTLLLQPVLSVVQL